MNKVKQFNMKIKIKLFDRLRKQAEEEGRSLSEIVRQILLEYLEKKQGKKTNPVWKDQCTHLCL